jgi:zinc protease
MPLRRLLVTSLLVLVAANTLFAAEPAQVKKITEIEGISEFRLSNGLKILLFPDASKPTVTVNLTVFVGSRHEGYGEAGMAHLLEHMVFKGTPTHSNVPKALSDKGARFNGTTWVDRTNYYETIPATDGNLEFAIRLEADRMVNSFIKGEDLKSEMTVVRNEFERGENSPGRVLAQRMMAASFQWHNYGRSTIGNRADIERVPVDNLRKFYRKFYQPDNAMLVVAGKFDPAKALQFAAKYFGVIPRPKRELPNTYTEEPAQDGEKLVTLRRVGDVAVVGAVYHITSGAHPDYPALDLLENILTSAPSGRLYKALVERKLASSVNGVAFAWHDPGVLRLVAEVTKGNAPQDVLNSMLDTLDTVAEKGATEEEVARAQVKYMKLIELGAANSGRLAIELSEWAAQGDWRLYFLYRDRIEKVTAEDVNRVAKTYLKRNNRTVGMYLPTEKPQRVAVPGTPDLAKMIGNYKGREKVAAGEVFDVTPANIESRTTRLKLAGGMQANLLPKKTRGESVNLRLTLRYGNEKNLSGLAKASVFLPSLMLRGTKQLTRQQLQDKLDKYRAQLGASGSSGTVTFTISTKREHLANVLGLLGQVLREPTLPAEELDILKRGQLARLEQQKTDPQSLAQKTVSRFLSPYPKEDPRYVPTIAEDIELVNSVTRSDIERLHKGYLGASNGELTVVGDFDPKEIVPVVEKMLAGWKAEQPYARLKGLINKNAKGGSQDILTPDKANATYFAAFALPMKDTDPDYAALVIGNRILGGGSLSSRLGDRVRQKDGLSYGVGSGFNARSLDPRAVFYLYAITNPANMSKVKTAIREELDKLLADGVTAEELAAAKKGYLDSQSVSRTSDSSLASTLASTTVAKRDMKYYDDLERQIQSLTGKQVVTALRKHIDAKKLLIVAAGDFAKPMSDKTKPKKSSKKQ